jgi:hypothetical protein
MPEGLVGHAAPELLEPWQAVRRFVAGDQARIDGADRGADDPVRLDAGLVQCLVDPGLVGAERTAALQHEDDLARQGRCLTGRAGVDFVRTGRFRGDSHVRCRSRLNRLCCMAASSLGAPARWLLPDYLPPIAFAPGYQCLQRSTISSAQRRHRRDHAGDLPIRDAQLPRATGRLPAPQLTAPVVKPSSTKAASATTARHRCCWRRHCRERPPL